MPALAYAADKIDLSCQAIEAKEGVTINNETVTLASISYQNFFRAYPKLSGMSGTASTETDEFNNIYNMSVQQVPTNRTIAREDSNDVVFRNQAGKWKNVLTEVKRMNTMGRPVLVGTTSVETSELMSSMLQEAGIKHEVSQHHKFYSLMFLLVKYKE